MEHRQVIGYRFSLTLLLATAFCLTTGANAATFFVTSSGTGDGSSWSVPLGNIQAAVDAASPGDQVWIAEGVYNATVEMATGVALYGGFVGGEVELSERDWRANRTVLNQMGNTDHPILRAVDVEGFILDRLFFQNGSQVHLEEIDSATMTHCTVADSWGFFCSSASPYVADCTFTRNSPHGIYAEFSEPTILRCMVSENRRENSNGAGMRLFVSDALVMDSTFVRNVAEAGPGATLASSQATMINCLIADNTGERGGGLLFTQPDSTLIGCTIARNRGVSGGGIYCDEGYPNLIECLIVDNYAEADGGAIFLGQASPKLDRCTLVRNRGDRGTGGILGVGGSPLLTNCILWNHGIELGNSFFPTARYSCVRGGEPGEGNISLYPEFQNPEAGEWSLMDFSPCIDAGTDTGTPFNGAAPDMGAFESPGSFTQGPGRSESATFHVSSTADSGGDGRSWTDALPGVGAALFRCYPGDEVWVEAGTYPEVIVLDKSVGVFGGFGGYETDRSLRNPDYFTTTLDASINWGDLPVVQVLRADNAVLEGFTLTGGNRPAKTGAGLVVEEFSSVLIRDCKILGNLAKFAPAFYSDESTVEIIDCDLMDNRSDQGAGCFALTLSDATFTNSVLAWNVAMGENAIGIVTDSNLAFENSTIANNSSGGGENLRMETSMVTFHNSIYWGNSSFTKGGASRPGMGTYTVFQGGLAGEGNLNTDPLFMDPNESDFRLISTSPAIDAGDPDPIFNDNCLPPGQGTERNDMGAFGGPVNCDRIVQGAPTPTPSPIPFTPSDLLPDGTVNSADLLRLLEAWRSEIGSGSSEDLFMDGVLDVKDLTVIQQDWYAVTGP